MIAPAHWRRGGPDGREAISAPGEVTSIATSVRTPYQSSGSITSRGYNPLSRRDVEFVAYQLQCNFATARKAIEMGLLKNG